MLLQSLPLSYSLPINESVYKIKTTRIQIGDNEYAAIMYVGRLDIYNTLDMSFMYSISIADINNTQQDDVASFVEFNPDFSAIGGFPTVSDNGLFPIEVKMVSNNYSITLISLSAVSYVNNTDTILIAKDDSNDIQIQSEELILQAKVEDALSTDFTFMNFRTDPDFTGYQYGFMVYTSNEYNVSYFMCLADGLNF